MDVKDAIERRRAYRGLEGGDVSDAMLKELTGAARLAPSCFNKQPWRYAFVREKGALAALQNALSDGNAWAKNAPMIIAVISKPELDCTMKDGRRYYQFDTGMATAFLILRATELGLVAHPIAGYSQRKAKEALNVPDDMEVLTLVIVGRQVPGKHEDDAEPRPERLPLEQFAYIDMYGKGLE